MNVTKQPLSGAIIIQCAVDCDSHLKIMEETRDEYTKLISQIEGQAVSGHIRFWGVADEFLDQRYFPETRETLFVVVPDVYRESRKSRYLHTAGGDGYLYGVQFRYADSKEVIHDPTTLVSVYEADGSRLD